MKRKIWILLFLVLVLSILTVSFSGCIEIEPTETPIPTLTPTPVPTPTPTPTPVVATPPVVTPTAHDSEEITYSPTTPSVERIDRHYEWSYGGSGSTWTWDLTLPESLYSYYKDKPRPPTRGDYSVYVTDPYDDAYIESLIKKFEEAAAKKRIR